MNHAQQIRSRARSVILQLELTSNGTTTSWDSDTAHQHASSRPPSNGDPHPPHLRFQHEMNTARDDRELEAVVERAEAELSAIRHGHTTTTEIRPESQTELYARIVKDGEGWTAKEVAINMRCLPRDVTTARRSAGREPIYGRATKHTPAVDKAEQARVMRADGATTRQIAEALDTHQTQIMRWIREAA